jgi:predicted cobalt transporter CbtA
MSEVGHDRRVPADRAAALRRLRLILWVAGVASFALGVVLLFVSPLYGAWVLVVSVACPVLMWRTARQIGR